MAVADLTAARLRELFHYDPDTGVLVRHVAKYGPKNRTRTPARYLRRLVDGVVYPTHRLAWLYMTGEWPTHHVDHINGIRSDNRWANLREATSLENAQNARAYKNNTSGFRGVYRLPDTHRTNRFQASIGHMGRVLYLGIFKTSEEAHSAYLKARAELFPFQPVPRET